MFRQLGATVVDADVLAHQVMEPRRLAWREIVAAFGERMVNDDQTIHRKRLAALVFRDEHARRRLERIIHPRVIREIKGQVRRLQRSRRIPAVVIDVPLLVETGTEDIVDALVVVTAPPDVQRKRLQDQHGWSHEEIDARIAAQWDLSAKVALADYVVDNSDGVDATRTQVKRLWEKLVPHHRSSSTSRRSKR
jgi:dephospho-CoA kinase